MESGAVFCADVFEEPEGERGVGEGEGVVAVEDGGGFVVELAVEGDQGGVVVWGLDVGFDGFGAAVGIVGLYFLVFGKGFLEDSFAKLEGEI